MSQEDVENNDTKTVTSNSLILKIFNIFLLLVLLTIIGVFLFVFISVSSGGNPNIDFSEVNETMAASHHISHLTDKEYQAFPKLRETIENPKADLNWSNGYRFLGITKISEEQKGFITGKYAYETNYMGYLEYQGKYYAFAISLS
jgi:hypothetical protein